MPIDSLAEDLAALLATVRRPGDFFVAGTEELRAPSLEIEGLGPVALPLLPAQAEAIAALAEPAPYGRGAATVFDPKVRSCRQIGPERVRLAGRHWARTLEAIVARAAEGLGVADPVSAEFYKLLLYRKGDFFLGHRDTEKAPGMFATLLVALPAHFAGGTLLVRHQGREAALDLRSDDPAEAPFAAFYADCVHEVQPVTDGARLILVYNLVRQGRGRRPEPPDHREQQAGLAALLARWREAKGQPADATPEKLVYPLEHAYTLAELGFAALKGADAAAAFVLAAAARQAGCELHLALLTIEESGIAEFTGNYASRRRWRDEEEDEFEVGEVTDRTMRLTDWRPPEGEPPPLGELPVTEADFSPPGACEELAPDEQHFHEASGNEGASFERSYRRAALVLWPGGRLAAVLAQAGLHVTLPYLGELVGRCTAESGDPAAPTRRQALDLAAQMLAQWPPPEPYRRPDDERPGPAATMLDLLTRLGDTGLVERFLAEVSAAGHFGSGDTAAVSGALAHLPPGRATALLTRLVEGNADSAFAACAALLARVATAPGRASGAGLGAAATRLVDRLAEGPARTAPADPWQARAPRATPGTVTDLLAGLVAIDPTLARRAVEQILAQRQTYGLDNVVVPAARRLFGAGATGGREAIAPLRAASLAHLRARIAEPLAPPADQRRDARLPCDCRFCAELSRFLADPARKVWTLKANEADRRHVEDCIRSAKADLDATTDRRGRPYSLVCTKTQASYERRAAQRRQDLEDLALLGG